MKIDRTLVRKLRLEKSWSQELLAEKAGLNLRTIQRIESTGAASLRTRRSIAAALGVDAAVLSSQQDAEPGRATETTAARGNLRKPRALAGLYALSAILLFAFVIADQLYARSIDAQGLTTRTMLVFSEVADFLLVLTFVSLSIAVGAICVVWRHAWSRWLLVASVVVGVVWPSALVVIGNSILPGLWSALHESGAGPVLRFAGQGIAAAFALWGFVAISHEAGTARPAAE